MASTSAPGRMEGVRMIQVALLRACAPQRAALLARSVAQRTEAPHMREEALRVDDSPARGRPGSRLDLCIRCHLQRAAVIKGKGPGAQALCSRAHGLWPARQRDLDAGACGREAVRSGRRAVVSAGRQPAGWRSCVRMAPAPADIAGPQATEEMATTLPPRPTTHPTNPAASQTTPPTNQPRTWGHPHDLVGPP